MVFTQHMFASHKQILFEVHLKIHKDSPIKVLIHIILKVGLKHLSVQRAGI